VIFPVSLARIRRATSRMISATRPGPARMHPGHVTHPPTSADGTNHRLRLQRAQLRSYFRASPRCRCARRRTGVKIGGGTARDVLSLWSRLRPRVSLTPGTGYLRGRSLCFEHAGQFLPHPPGSPGGPCSQASAGRAGLPGENAGTDGRGD
jgi:hypothetical protein